MTKATYKYGLSQIKQNGKNNNLVLKSKLITIPFSLPDKNQLGVTINGVETDEYIFHNEVVIVLNKTFTFDDLPLTVEVGLKEKG